MAENYQNGQKTLWEKEKLLVTSNFSFSQSVFKRIELQTRKNLDLFGKGLIHVVFAFKITLSSFQVTNIRLVLIKGLRRRPSKMISIEECKKYGKAENDGYRH